MPDGDYVSRPMKKVRLWGHIPAMKRDTPGLEDDGCRIVFFYREGFWQVDCSPSEWDITHWQPLPEPPK